MSINAYVGLPGTGKSYGVVANVILPALREGREVWTNIPMNEDELRSEELHERLIHFDTSEPKEKPEWFLDTLPPGAVLVLDECWRLWPAGWKANQIPEPYKTFLAEHRHLVGADGKTTEICLVTQDLSQIAAFARQLVETTYRTTKLKALGSKKHFRLDVYSGPVAGARPPASQLLRQIPGKYKAEVWRFYKSHTKSDQVGEESDADKRANIWRSPLVLFSLFGCPILFIFAVWTVVSYFQSWGEPAQAAEAQSANVDVTQPMPPPWASTQAPPVSEKPAVEDKTVKASEPEEPQVKYSDRWRIGGELEKEEERKVVITDGRWNRLIPFSLCERIEGGTVCTWQGEHITEWSGGNRGFMHNVVMGNSL